MYRPRERHNAKARQSTTDSHKKKSERNKSSASDSVEVPELDVNAEVITPKTQEQKELDRKEKLKQEVRSEVLCLDPSNLTVLPR